ncbi:TPA: hypothetical protein ACNPUM_004613 [Escherichia coli]
MAMPRKLKLMNVFLNGYASMPHMRVQAAISLTRQKSVITSVRT